MREYYDLWPKFAQQISKKGRVKETFRRSLVRIADKYLLTHNVNQLYAQSKTIQKRLQKWGNVPSEVLYPPPPPRSYGTEDYECTVLAVSRLHPLKRLDLLIKALKQVENANLRAIIAGTGEEDETLRRLAFDLEVANRVTFLGHVDDETLLSCYARCRAVFFAPFMEDFGFVTLESFRSKKPVLTCSDSGGPAELVVHDRSGFVVEPDPRLIAQRLDIWASHRDRAVQMGEAGHRDTSDITWEAALNKLLLP
jgi:glycosyltransferase involved in cell wall biosynthesis